MRVLVIFVTVLGIVLGAVPVELAAGASRDRTRADRVEELRREVDKLAEDVEDLQEPMQELELFDECAYAIGVSERGRRNGSSGYLFRRGRTRTRRPALALDIRGFGRPDYWFVAFPAEEPPSIECNEDAGQEESDDD